MPNSIPFSTLEKFTSFGDLLRYLRRRAGLTQLELSIAVGYSDPHISRLEQNMRLPDIPTIQARFINPLGLENEPQAVARLLELAANVRREDAPSPGLCPYKGMDYFDENDADLFVGREALTEKLVNEILALGSDRHAGDGRFFAVVGASGSGKSSLVRAGLIPALHWNKTSANWLFHTITPANNPLESLAVSLTGGESMAAAMALMDDLKRDHRTLSLYAGQVLKTRPGSHLLLVVDQFEELFTLCRSEKDRFNFIDCLLTAAYDEQARVIVVIALRADFYAYCASYPILRKALAKHQEYIGAMSDAEMLRAIEEPARRGHWEFEPGLVDIILHDVGHEPGALPLLSHALLETWQRRRGRKLILSGYASSGGVRGAIAETAETVFTDQFNYSQQAIARRIFLRLTELGDETSTGDTRRRATISELILKPEEADATQAVLKILADARLVTTCDDYVQVAHEALIREWPTLRGWLEENREGLRLHRQLTEAAREWLESERDSSQVFRGARLAQARDWANVHSDEMNVLEHEFLAASIEFSEHEAAEREAARQRELEAAQKLVAAEKLRAEEGIRSGQRLKKRAILMSIVGVIASILAIITLIAWRQASYQAAFNRSLSLSAAAEKMNNAGQGDLALLLAMEAIKSDSSSSEALSAFRTIATGFGTRAILSSHSQAARDVAISPDESKAFSGSCRQLDAQGACSTGELILWDLVSNKELRGWTGHKGWVTRVAFSLDGQTLISGAEDGSLIMWDLNGKQVDALPRRSGPITGLVVVPLTGDLLAGSADGSLILWDLKTRQKIREYEGISSPIVSLAAARDTLAAVTAHADGNLARWDLNYSHYSQLFLGKAEGISAIAISPDAAQIIVSKSTIADIAIHIIDGHSGDGLGDKLFGCVPGDLVFDAGTSSILLACSHAIMQVDLQSLSIQSISLESSGVQTAVAIAPNRRLGLSALLDGTLKVWNLGHADSETINIDADTLNALAVDPEGKYLLLNDATRNIYNQPVLWDIAKKEIIKTFYGFDAMTSPGAAAISPDNRYVAIAGGSIETSVPLVMIWERESGLQHCKFKDFSENGRALAFSPDSKYLLAGSQILNGIGGHLILYETQTCRIIRTFETTEEVSSVCFNADGTLALTGSSLLGRVILWDVNSGKEIRRYSSPPNQTFLDVIFGPGETTVLASGIGELYLWDLQTGTQLRRFIGNPSAPWKITLSPDEKYILSGGMNGDVILWDFATGKKVSQDNLNSAVFSVAFGPEGKDVYAASKDGRLLIWHIAEKPLSELLEWVAANRYVREFNCEERALYQVDPQCETTPVTNR